MVEPADNQNGPNAPAPGASVTPEQHIPDSPLHDVTGGRRPTEVNWGSLNTKVEAALKADNLSDDQRTQLEKSLDAIKTIGSVIAGMGKVCFEPTVDQDVARDRKWRNDSTDSISRLKTNLRALSEQSNDAAGSDEMIDAQDALRDAAGTIAHQQHQMFRQLIIRQQMLQRAIALKKSVRDKLDGAIDGDIEAIAAEFDTVIDEFSTGAVPVNQLEDRMNAVIDKLVDESADEHKSALRHAGVIANTEFLGGTVEVSKLADRRTIDLGGGVVDLHGLPALPKRQGGSDTETSPEKSTDAEQNDGTDRVTRTKAALPTLDVDPLRAKLDAAVDGLDDAAAQNIRGAFDHCVARAAELDHGVDAEAIVDISDEIRDVVRPLTNDQNLSGIEDEAKRAAIKQVFEELGSHRFQKVSAIFKGQAATAEVPSPATTPTLSPEDRQKIADGLPVEQRAAFTDFMDQFDEFVVEHNKMAASHAAFKAETQARLAALEGNPPPNDPAATVAVNDTGVNPATSTDLNPPTGTDPSTTHTDLRFNPNRKVTRRIGSQFTMTAEVQRYEAIDRRSEPDYVVTLGCQRGGGAEVSFTLVDGDRLAQTRDQILAGERPAEMRSNEEWFQYEDRKLRDAAVAEANAALERLVAGMSEEGLERMFAGTDRGGMVGLDTRSAAFKHLLVESDTTIERSIGRNGPTSGTIARMKNINIEGGVLSWINMAGARIDNVRIHKSYAQELELGGVDATNLEISYCGDPQASDSKRTGTAEGIRARGAKFRNCEFKNNTMQLGNFDDADFGTSKFWQNNARQTSFKGITAAGLDAEARRDNWWKPMRGVVSLFSNPGGGRNIFGKRGQFWGSTVTPDKFDDDHRQAIERRTHNDDRRLGSTITAEDSESHLEDSHLQVWRPSGPSIVPDRGEELWIGSNRSAGGVDNPANMGRKLDDLLVDAEQKAGRERIALALSYSNDGAAKKAMVVPIRHDGVNWVRDEHSSLPEELPDKVGKDISITEAQSIAARFNNGEFDKPKPPPPPQQPPAGANPGGGPAPGPNPGNPGGPPVP